MTKNEIIDNLYELSQCVLEVASDLEKDKMDIDNIPKCFMDIIIDSTYDESWIEVHRGKKVLCVKMDNGEISKQFLETSNRRFKVTPIAIKKNNIKRRVK